MQTKDVLTDKSSHDEYFSDINDKFLVLKNRANKLGVNVVLKKWVAPDFNLKYQLIISKGKKFENDVDITLEAALLRNFIKAFLDHCHQHIGLKIIIRLMILMWKNSILYQLNQLKNVCSLTI